MRYNTAKQKMFDGQPAIGGAACMGSPLAAEVLAKAGVDYVLVDDQHGMWQPDSIMAAFRSILVAGLIGYARGSNATVGPRLLGYPLNGVIPVAAFVDIRVEVSLRPEASSYVLPDDYVTPFSEELRLRKRCNLNNPGAIRGSLK